MTAYIGLHRITSMKAGARDKATWLDIEAEGGISVALHVDAELAMALQAAFDTWRDGKAAELRAHQMNAELPAAIRATLQLKGMI